VKILYVSQYFPPEMGAPAARVSELAEIWARDGHQVTVLTGFPNHPTGVVPAEYRAKLRRLLIREELAGVEVVRTWLWPRPNRKSYERILNYSSFFFSSAITGLFLRKPDVVIGTSPQLLTALSAWWLARVKRVPFVFEVRDLWPESLGAVGMAAEESALYRVLGKLAAFLYKRADRIVVVSGAFKSILCERWNVPPEKISVVPNGVKTEKFSPAAGNEKVREQLGLQGKFVATYIGTLGVAHGLETLVEAAAQLQNSAPHVEFLLIGDGADKERIAAMVEARGITNVRFLGQRPREVIPQYICASDVCLVLLRKTELFKTVIPSKMLEFMACEKPLVLAVDGEARRIMDEARCGLFVEPENSSALAEAILTLASDTAVRQQLGANGRRAILQKYSRKATAQSYREILSSVVNASAVLLDCDDADGRGRLHRRLERASG